eukprot:TRINITY_DN36059_c0_g1_i1.p1 TRINITY_DN36059_c0_g1~~TRINITY_DN36059_c0_g1_i1.p1  ORF type:complete len:2018 (-),score=588.94 TRINITY_DN36059_c0_g1_i1:318-5702(-)
MSVQVVVYQLPCHGCSQLRYQAQAVYKTSYENLEDPVQDFKKRYGRLKEKLELKKTLDHQFDSFKRMTRLENSSWSSSFVPVHAVLNGLPEGWQAVVVAVVNREFGIIRVSTTDIQQGMAPTMLHVLFHIGDVYDVHGYKMTASNMSMESLTDQHVDLTARTICKRNKPAGIFDVHHKLALENATYVGIPLLQAIVVCVKMNPSSPPVTRSVPKPTVLRKEPGSFDSEVSAYYLQYGLKVKLDIKVVQFIAIKNKPSLPYEKHMVSNYSFRDEKEVLEGLKSIDSEASQQLIYGKLNMKDVRVPTNENLPLEISRIECSIKFLYRSHLMAERGIVEIKPLVDKQTMTCLAYFQYSDLYKQQEQDFQCKDLAVLMPASSKDKFCVSVHLWKSGYQVPYIVTAIWNETLRLRLGMPEPRPAPCSPEALSYREPIVREVVASCQDEIEVVTEPTSAQTKENETPGSKKIKIPLKAGKAKAGLVDIYQDFVSLKPDGSVVEIFDNCEGTVEKVIGEHYLVINLSVPPDDGGKKIRILATSTDIIASYDPESLDSVTKVSNAKAAHTGINLYDLALPGDNVRFNAVLLAADNSTIQYCSTCVVIDPKRYMAKLVVPSNPGELLRPLPMPKFIPLLPEVTSKPFGNMWKETYQKIVSSLDGNLDLEGPKDAPAEAVRLLSVKAPTKVSAMDLRPCPAREKLKESRNSRSQNSESDGKKNSARHESKSHNLIYINSDDTVSDKQVVQKLEPESSDKYDPYQNKKIYGRVIKILNPNYGIGICHSISDDGTSKSFQVLFDIFDVWIDDQVVAKMNKKLPDVMVVGDYLQMLYIKVEACEGQAKRVVEHMATAAAIAKSYQEVKTKRFPAAVVPLERIELIDESKIDNFRKVVKILKGMEPDETEKKVIEDLKKEMKNLIPSLNKLEDKCGHVKKSSKEQIMHEPMKEIKEECSLTDGSKDTQIKEIKKSKDPGVDLNKSTDSAKSPEPPKAVFGLSFQSVANDYSQEKSMLGNPVVKESSSDPVISIFTVKVLKNIEGSYWLGYTTSEMAMKAQNKYKISRPKRVLINAVLLEKSLLVEEGMILNCDISSVVIEDPKDSDQEYHIAYSVQLNPNEEIILDDKRWKPKTKLAKYKPVVESIFNLEFSNAQCRLLLGKAIPRVFFINQALPKVLINQTGVVISLLDSSSAIIRLDVKDKTKRGLQFLHILADNEYRSNLDQEFHPTFSVGYPVTFHAIKLEEREDKDVQYLATDVCLHLDPKRYDEFWGCGNSVNIESVLAFPTFKQVKQKLSQVSVDKLPPSPNGTSFCRGIAGHVKAVDDEIILIEHLKQERKWFTIYMKTRSERSPKSPLTVKDGQEVVCNFLDLNQAVVSGLVTQLWLPADEVKESDGFRDLTAEHVNAFNLKVTRMTNPAKLQHLIPRSFIKLQSNYNKDNLQRLISLYVEALGENVELEGINIPAPLSFQNIVSGANFEMTPKDAKQFLLLLGDVFQECIGPKKEAYWDIALERELVIGDVKISSSQAVLIKEIGLTNPIKLLPRTRKNLLSWRYPEDWVLKAEKYSSFGIDGSSFAACPQGWSRVDDSKLLAGALEHGLLFDDSNTEKSWANLADDLGYGLGSKIFQEGVLQPFVLSRLGYLRRVAEGRGRFCYDCEEDSNTLLICNVATIKGEVTEEEEEPATRKSPLFIYDLNSTGSSSVEEATVVVKEECFEVDDALSLPAQGKPLDSDLDEMEKSLNIALEEMEKAAALVEDSYESELGDQGTLESLENTNLTPLERSVISFEEAVVPMSEDLADQAQVVSDT